jgi:hypothetical protein
VVTRQEGAAAGVEPVHWQYQWRVVSISGDLITVEELVVELEPGDGPENGQGEGDVPTLPPVPVRIVSQVEASTGRELSHEVNGVPVQADDPFHAGFRIPGELSRGAEVPVGDLLLTVTDSTSIGVPGRPPLGVWHLQYDEGEARVELRVDAEQHILVTAQAWVDTGEGELYTSAVLHQTNLAHMETAGGAGGPVLQFAPGAAPGAAPGSAPSSAGAPASTGRPAPLATSALPGGQLVIQAPFQGGASFRGRPGDRNGGTVDLRRSHPVGG